MFAEAGGLGFGGLGLAMGPGQAGYKPAGGAVMHPGRPRPRQPDLSDPGVSAAPGPRSWRGRPWAAAWAQLGLLDVTRPVPCLDGRLTHISRFSLSLLLLRLAPSTCCILLRVTSIPPSPSLPPPPSLLPPLLLLL